MKKWISYVSYGVNAILIAVLLFILTEEETVPAPVKKPFNPSVYTQQDLDRSIEIKAEMNTEEVLSIMGSPVKKELTGSTEEWHYCRTGEVVDEYVSIEFNESKVSNLSIYTVDALDVVFRHTDTPTAELTSFLASGDCKLFIR